MSPNGVGGGEGGVNRKGGPYYRKNDFHTEGLLEGGGGLTGRWVLIEILQ